MTRRFLLLLTVACALMALSPPVASATFTADGGWSGAGLTDGKDVATDAGGNSYVGDTLAGSAVVLKYDPSGNYVHQWSLGPGSGWGVELDSSGNLYGVNRGTNEIYKLTAPNAAGNSGAFAVFTMALNQPAGIAIDEDNGVIYVAESGRHTVRIVALATGAVLGEIGTANTASATDGQLDTPYAVDVDPTTGKVFVADTGNGRIQRFAAYPSNAYETKWSVGSAYGVAVHPTDGRIYVTETSFDMLRIYKSDGTSINAVGGSGSGAAQFNDPLGAEVRATDGSVLVADNGNDRTRRWINTAPALTFTGGPSGDTSSTTANFTFTSPEAATFACSDAAGSGSNACTTSTATSGTQDFSGLSQGSHTFKVTGTDAFGNALTITRLWFVDTVNPVASLDDVTPEALLTNQNDFTFDISASDTAPSSSAGTDGFDFQCSLNGGTSWVDCDGSLTPVVSPVSWVQNDLADGVYNFKTRVIDNAGNVSAATSTYTFTVDTTPPTIVINRPYEDARYSKFADPKPDLTADYECDDLNGVALCNGNVADGAYFNRDMTTDPTAKTFVVNATDNAGNVGSDTANYRVFSFEGLIKDDSPLGFWRLGDGTGASTMDDAMNLYDGEYKNRNASVAFGISGDGNSSRRFFGQQGYGFANGIPAPDVELSLGAFVKLDDLNGDGKADDAMVAQQGGAAALWVKDERVRFLHTDWDRTSEVTGPVLNEDTWYHVMGTWDGQYSRLYVNGLEVATYDTTPSVDDEADGNTPSGSSTFYIGYGDKASWLSGYLDEVAYFDHALSALHVYEHWLADPPPNVPPPASAADKPRRAVWRRADGSLVSFVRRGDVVLGKIVKRASGGGCRLARGAVVLRLTRSGSSYSGTVVAPAGTRGRCSTRNLRVTGTVKDGVLTLVRRVAGDRVVERVVRQRP